MPHTWITTTTIIRAASAVERPRGGAGQLHGEVAAADGLSRGSTIYHIINIAY